MRIKPSVRISEYIFAVIALYGLIAANELSAQPPVSGTWVDTGSLNAARQWHTATLLHNGMVLVAGGATSFGVSSSAIMYNPRTMSWATTGSLNTGRYLHTATLLYNGMVLVSGGFPGFSSSAELFRNVFRGVQQPMIIFSNFGPGMTFDTDPSHSWTINGFLGPSTGQQAISQQFTPSGDFRFTDAGVALWIFQGPISIVVFLQADSGGLPGEVLEQINVTGLTAIPTIIVANSVLRPKLQNGTPYWLTAVAGAPGVIAGWNWNSIGDSSSSTFASTQGGSPTGPWGIDVLSTRGAFQINGEPR